ncbi:bifunctional riboflavin kinase/FAD synthetase [Candidatus Gracilibacteria bacterium]|nr:bifunctional riboflavin kinase/FAD synthetase [Candidatus Gracilibacteria bacterium]
MYVAYSLAAPLTNQPTVLTMGKFDGLHLGHQALIGTVVEHARRHGFASAVLTWEPHPNLVTRPDQELLLLSSREEKIDQIAALNPDILIIAPFTRETMATSAEQYMRQISVALPLRELWVGEDFAMGRGRTGDVSALITIGATLGFAVGTIKPVFVEGEPVSASRVRRLLGDGQVEAAVALLGRPYSMRGLVVEGDKRGRTIGFPTANLSIEAGHTLPAHGVYACVATLPDGTRHAAVTNVGVRPTFGGLQATVEAHLLDWSGDLYGQTITVEFHHRLRGEQKFSSIDDLKAQIARDVEQAHVLLRA